MAGGSKNDMGVCSLMSSCKPGLGVTIRVSWMVGAGRLKPFLVLEVHRARANHSGPRLPREFITTMPARTCGSSVGGLEARDMMSQECP